jgi:hypothetical protein
MMCPRAALLIAALTACGGGGGFPDAPPEPDAAPGGTLSLDWSLVKMADGTPVSCDAVGAGTVTLLLRNRAMQGGFTEVFSCNTKSGTTPQIPIGTYDVNFELTGTSGLITTAPEQTGLIVTRLQNTPLQPVTFTVNATGAIDLRIDALKTGGNCDPIATNGAGITQMRIFLDHVSGGACEPATIMIGAAPYTINCAAPTPAGCIEKTTAITGTLPSDNYQIHIRADQAAAMNCFVNDDSMQVPPNGKTLTRTLNLAASAGAGCL